MNQSFQRVLEKTLIAMIAANPRHYLSTQLEAIQVNLDVWEGVDASGRTISRGLHNLDALGIIRLKVVPVAFKGGEWHGKKILIEATEKLWSYVRTIYHNLRKFLHLTERTRMSVEPTPTKSRVLRNSPTFPKYILSDICPPGRQYPAFKKEDLPQAQNLKPFWQDPGSFEGYLAFKGALKNL